VTNSEGANELRAPEGRLLQKRIERMKSGQRIGLATDIKMREELWYVEAADDLSQKYSIDARGIGQKEELERWLRKKEVAEMLQKKAAEEDDWYNEDTRNLMNFHWTLATAHFNTLSQERRVKALGRMVRQAKRHLRRYDCVSKKRRMKKMRKNQSRNWMKIQRMNQRGNILKTQKMDQREDHKKNQIKKDRSNQRKKRKVKGKKNKKGTR
jgi:hypothetical protein